MNPIERLKARAAAAGITDATPTDAAVATSELDRILALPRRPVPDPETLRALGRQLEERLGLGATSCKCESKFQRTCCQHLMPTQAWALHEMALAGGLVGPIGVGHGKTLLDLLAPMAIPCRVALLIVPSNLVTQLLEADVPFYSGHWKLPNIVGSTWQYPGRPLLHILGYSRLSGAKSTELLETINPDLIILDEAHSLSDTSSVRGKRFMRYLRAHPGIKLAAWSGTLTKRSLNDWAHFPVHALKAGSPVPRDYPSQQFWASATDPSDFSQGPAGDLVKLCAPGESVEAAFGRRVQETLGVVSSGDATACQASLVILERPLPLSESVRSAVAKVRDTWQRPDGEELVDPLAVARCMREVSCGFYYYWAWPRGESKAVRTEWLDARKAWHQELREKLKRSTAHMDSPLLLTRAAIRWFEGFTYVDPQDRRRRRKVPPHSRESLPGHPTWASETWERWKKARPTAQPVTATTWFDESMLRDVEAWLSEGPGLAWYEHDAIRAAVKLPKGALVCGPGPEGNLGALSLRGSEPVLISIKAHGTGKNLQMFHRNLVVNPPSGGAEWEQLMGRTDRFGQKADEVTFEVYRHTKPLRDAVETARARAEYIQGVFGNLQKLVSKATWTFGVDASRD